MSVSAAEILSFMEELCPPSLAEDWDNTGLLLGDPQASIERIVTCLTLTPDVADEALAAKAQLIVSHHPILFRPVQSITANTVEGRMLLKLMREGIAVYSPHTSFDSAGRGINVQLSEKLGLQDVRPIRPGDGERFPKELGSGRWGRLERPTTLRDFLSTVKDSLGVPNFQWTGREEAAIETVAVACGSAAEFLRDASKLGCDLFLTGEARFHSFLEARSLGIALVTIGHYQSERPAVEDLANVLNQQFPSIEVWPSRIESDPVRWSVGDE